MASLRPPRLPAARLPLGQDLDSRHYRMQLYRRCLLLLPSVWLCHKVGQLPSASSTTTKAEDALCIHSLVPLCFFCVAWGLTGGSFGAMYSRLSGIIAGDDAKLGSLLFSIWFFVRGSFCIIAGPFSTVLLTTTGLSQAKFGYGVSTYVSSAVSQGCQRRRRLIQYARIHRDPS